MGPLTMLIATVVLQVRQPGGFQQGGGGAEAAAMAVIQLVVALLIGLPILIGMWAVFTKAGKPGWAAIVPIYNVIVLLEIADKPVWWVLLFCCPVVNIIVRLIVVIEVANKFNQGAGFGIGMFCLPSIFYPILGFGSAEHQGTEGRRRRRRREYEDDDDEDDSPRRRR